MLYTNMQITESSHGKFCSYSYLHTIRTTSILNPYSGVLSKHSIAVCVHNIVGVCTLHCDVQLYIRCGRVMADNIAYAKFRKTLLI